MPFSRGIRRPHQPAPPDRRYVARPALVALGVLLIVGCAGAGAELSGRSNHDHPYLAVVRAIPPGGAIRAGDLTSVGLDPPAGLALVPAADLASVLGDEAEFELPAGSLLDPSLLSATPSVLAGDAVVGASLASNQLPDELQPGDEVIIVFTSTQAGAIATAPSTGLAGGGSGAGSGSSSTSAAPSTSGTPPSPATGTSSSPGSGSAGSQPSTSAGGGAGAETAVGNVITTAQVLDVVVPGSASAVSAAAGDLEIVSLAVPQRAAALVTAASAANEISLALVPGTARSPR